jgi:hypothetical protein
MEENEKKKIDEEGKEGSKGRISRREFRRYPRAKPVALLQFKLRLT